MKQYGESVYGTEATGIPEQSWGVTTKKGDIIYLHLIGPLEGVAAISLPVDGKVKEVRKMKDGSPMKFKVSDGRLSVELDEVPSEADLVLEVVMRD